MHPRQISLLYLSLLLFSFTTTGVSFARGALLGGYRPIKNLNDQHVIEIAQFAVTEHNKEDGTDLEFKKVVKGESQVVAGTNYRLVIAAMNGADLGDYEAVVYERPWENYRKLTSFEKV
ncbi:hypothetical protein Ancab_004790 [Ancistrocladus abbreviatus]